MQPFDFETYRKNSMTPADQRECFFPIGTEVIDTNPGRYYGYAAVVLASTLREYKYRLFYYDVSVRYRDGSLWTRFENSFRPARPEDMTHYVI